jgi:hypothetical protein
MIYAVPTATPCDSYVDNHKPRHCGLNKEAPMGGQEGIRNLFYRYAHGLDQRDFDLAGSIFSPDCVIQGTFASGSVSEYWPEICERVKEYERTMHLMGNIYIEETDPGGRAKTETYCIAHHLDPVGGGSPWIIAVIYSDVVERSGDHWQVVERRVAKIWEKESL